MLDIFNKFDNLPENYIPDNMHRCPRQFHLDIMTGENAIHTFEMPFKFMEECSAVDVIYKHGLEVVLVKSVAPNDVNDEDNIVTITLTPEETNLFTDNILDTNVQLKFTMSNDNIVFSEIYKVNVVNSLKNLFGAS